jgi:fido (protein-threonine AMPylation protein)
MASQSDVLKSLNWSPEKQDTFFNKLAPADQKQVLKQQGWSDEKVNAFYTKLDPYKAPGTPDTPAEQRTTGQKIAGVVAPYARPVLELGGAIGGAALAAPETLGIGALAGAGLGYAGGRQAANALEEYAGTRKLSTIGKAATEVVNDIPVGATMEAGGQITGAILGKVAPYVHDKLSKASERIYGSATKMPLSKKWTQVLPGREISARISAIRAGLDKGVMPTEAGIEQAAQLEAHTRAIVDDIIKTGTKAGDTVKTSDILQGLDRAYQSAAHSGDPQGAASIVDMAAAKFMNRPSVLSTQDLNQIKRQLYKEVADYTGEFRNINDTAQKGLANKAMTKLEEFYPEIKGLNKKDAAYIKLKEAIERTVGREQNKDIIGLGAKALAIKNIPLAILEHTIGHPIIKARLAIALARSGQSGATTSMLRLMSMEGIEKETSSALQNASRAGIFKIPDLVPSAGAGPFPKFPEPEPPKESAAPAPTKPAAADKEALKRQKGETLKQYTDRLYKLAGPPAEETQQGDIIGDHGRY